MLGYKTVGKEGAAWNSVDSLKERAGMPAGMAQSSAADFHEQKIMDLRKGHELGGGSGPSEAAQWLFQTALLPETLSSPAFWGSVTDFKLHSASHDLFPLKLLAGHEAFA